MTKPKPRLPEIGESIRLCGRLVEIQDVTPQPVAKVLDFVFEEVTAAVVVKANGLRLTEGPTFNDFSGSARDSAIAEAKRLAKAYGDGVEVVVIEKRQHVRKRPTGRESYYAHEFFAFERLDNGCRWNLPEDREEQVWSSKAGGT